MLVLARWKMVAIVLACLAGIVYTAPNFMPEALRSALPGFMPSKTINLGLDLRGGAHLLYQVDIDQVFADRAADIRSDARVTLREEEIRVQRVTLDGFDIMLQLQSASDVDAAKKALRKAYSDYLVAEEEGVIRLSLKEDAVTRIKQQVIEQSIEIVRRRIDALGTTEPLIQRQGDDRILVQAPGADAQGLKDVIGTTAKLTFHLLSSGGSVLRLPHAEDPNNILSLDRRAVITGDMLDDAYPTDQQGQVAIGFKLSSIGARRFCDVTRANVNKPFAIVLDEKVLSAPVIQSAICGGSGVITGNFDYKSANDLAMLLRAGALPAPMSVVEERSVGPSLGADSVEAGEISSLVGLAAILVFMVIAYGLFGVFSAFALLINVGCLLGLLSMLQATLTLPGIAGIVLTLGMAVDANVLIFERMREEVAKGRSAINAIEAGYRNAMSTIVDANLTTLIAAFILFSFGTGPVKGFAVTLALGIITSFFTAIMVSRLFIIWWLRGRRVKELPL